MLPRRKFLQRSATAAAALVFSRKFSFPPSASNSRIEILLNEPLGAISPNIYGHFTENLGGVIYDGIWLGENSKVRNTHGLRSELIEAMRKIKAPVIRFPGGCFADSYDWRDGIGPRDKRPRRTNFWAQAENPSSPANHNYDPNQFGTNEFLQFCKLIGSQPYLAANVRSLSAGEFYRWVEYCNSPAGTTTLADMRAASGFPDPFNVRFWGVGNESWGCGGNFTPQEYAVEFRRYATWIPGYGEKLSLIASGPNVEDWDWTRGFLEELVRKGKSQLSSVYGLALHHYAWNLSRGRTQNWEQGKGDALKFEPVDWYELLREGQRMESLITSHWQIMAEHDPDHSIKLIVDEWGPWYRPGSEATPGDLLEQTPTLRDAVFSAMTLDIFNRHPEKVAMANCAQLINCLNSLYLAHENNFCVTPVGHIFEMYAAHQAGQAVRCVFSAPEIHYQRDAQTATHWGLQGSASLHDKTLVITAVNPSITDARETQLILHDAKVKSATATTLTNSDIHAHNTFTQKSVVIPRTETLEVHQGSLVHTLPPSSVTKLTVELT
jgi:alpha-N-arabinofuranosidase